MGWIVLIGWLFAIVIAIIVLGFCGYELAWKTGRLRRDGERLQERVAELSALQLELSAAQARIPARPKA